MTLGIAITLAIVCILIAIFVGIKMLPRLSSERFSNIASSIYNITASIAIILGGLWTVTTFDVLNQKQAAEQDLKHVKEQTRLVKINYEQLKNKIENVEASKIDITTEVVNYKGAFNKNGYKGVAIKVNLANLGSAPIKFNVRKGVLKIYEVGVDGIQSGYHKLYQPRIISDMAPLNGKGAESTPLDNFILLASAERTLNYFAVLPTDKMYYIVFKTEAEGLEGNSKKECDKDGGCSWFISKYLHLPAE
jgi:hypothetical protein